MTDMNPASPRQLPLRLSLNDEATFDNFYAPVQDAGHELPAVMHLKQRLYQWATAGEVVPQQGTVLSDFTWLWGSQGAGCSHLLQAVSHQADAAGLAVFYLDMAMLDELSPDILIGLEAMDVLCLDHIESVFGQAEWEQALFHLYNRLVSENTALLIAGQRSPAQCQLSLADLQSRLQSAVVFHVPHLTDEQKVLALQMRANRRGFELGSDVAEYLVRRCERSTTTLFGILQDLDQHSLATRRKVTIPLLRTLLDEQEAAQ
ncbi:DnaA regulatory inactivator Hda [Pseudohongiella nitratireducens]|uniref:DnaA regulatory inactivator Hda n=1 Tax=Pseudohongiella nitratireducens TaxID=1768907 RepID=UPI0030EB1AEC